MLRMSVAAEEYVMIGDNIKVIFLGGTGKHMRIMIDAPKDVAIARSKAIEKRQIASGDGEHIHRYYAQPEYPEKYKKR
ncbi:MAG: carbon storage regulator [Eubacteriales bacterium]|nr:carbon storage regulator [Eubacteriales bacterium]